MKPILFNAEMVRAILEGRKTVTRRLVKPQPDKSAHSPYEGVAGRVSFRIGQRGCTDPYKPPYRTGDILYVRETWAIIGTDGTHHKYGYKADNEWLVPLWRPSIHMPREAARIFLRVTDVRVEKLQDITHSGIEKEGIVTIGTPGSPDRINPFFAFKSLWDSTIKPADRLLYGGEANPWVWVIEFERCEKP